MKSRDSVADFEWVCILIISVSYKFRVSREAAKSRRADPSSASFRDSSSLLRTFAASREFSWNLVILSRISRGWSLQVLAFAVLVHDLISPSKFLEHEFSDYFCLL